MNTPKQHIDDLALFGGTPIFDSPRPIGQLDAPPVEEYLALVRLAMDQRRLTNDGPFVQQLETRLAAYHGVAHCVALANAGLGLMMLMQVFSGGRRGEVIMPAFSYRGLPHFAQWAGQMPRFCDVDPATHTLSPESVASAINENTTAILAVCNFNSPGDIDRLGELAQHHDLPFFLDSVYGIGSTYKGRRLGGFGRAEVFSLHATKLLNGFEGGYITTNDTDLAEILRRQRNFGFGAESKLATSQIIGINAKLNELHAAMALLSLDNIDHIIAANRARFEEYVEVCAGIPGLSLIPYPAGECSNFQMAVVEIGPDWPLSRDQTIALLRAEGAAISAYYSPPLHLSEHCPRGLAINALPVAESLAERFMQLPSGNLVSLADIHAIGELLRFLGDNGAGIASRPSVWSTA